MTEQEYIRKLSALLDTIFNETAIKPETKRAKHYNEEIYRLVKPIDDDSTIYNKENDEILHGDHFPSDGESSEEIYNHHEYIRRITQKLKFTSSCEAWEKGYIFYNSAQANQCINQSKEYVVKWLEKYLKNFGKPLAITGQVGSGKSSLLKYLMITQQDSFLNNFTIPCRIEFSVIRDELQDVNKAAWREHIINTICERLIRDILFNMHHRKWINQLYGDNTSFSDEFFKWCRKKIDGSRILKEIENNRPFQYDFEYLEYAVKTCHSGSSCTSEIANMSRAFKILLIEFVQKSMGFKFLIVLDGFDAITPNDHFGVGGFHDILRALISIIKTRINIIYSYRDTISNISYSINLHVGFLILLRHNTLTYFLSNWGMEDGHDRPDFRFVKAPKFTEIIEGRLLATKYDLKIDDEEISKEAEGINTVLFRTVRGMSVIAAKLLINDSEFKKEDFDRKINIREDEDLSEFFNHNIRVCLEYYYVVLKHIIYMSTSMYTKRKISHEGKLKRADLSSLMFAYDYISNSLSVASSKKYKLVKSLLIGLNDEYHNLTMSTSKQVPLEIYGKRICPDRTFPELVRARGSLCDNVFNYHRDFESMLDHRATVPALFEKVRILQILICEQNKKSESESYVSVKELKTRMAEWFGHIYTNSGELYLNLQILVYAEFISLKDSYDMNFDEDSLGVSITKLGRYVVDNLCYRIEYIEHVILRTRLPKSIRDMISVPKSGCGMMSNKIWRVSAIRNFYIFYQYAKWVESIEENYTREGAGGKIRDKEIPNWRISSKMLLNRNSLDAMIKSNDKRHQSGQSLEWDADFLVESIAEAENVKIRLSQIDRL